MNPHFLYNILMSIKGLSLQGDKIGVGTTCDLLSEILRYSSSFNSKTVFLQDELDNCYSYLALMKVRYEDFLEYNILDETEDFSLIEIPKMIIQPLIENCFAHGFENKKPPYRIHLSFLKNKNKWQLSISDNGCGFTEEYIETFIEKNKEHTRLLQQGTLLENSDFGGLGIKNVSLRMQYFNKENSIFIIENNSESGATIIIGGSIDV